MAKKKTENNDFADILSELTEGHEGVILDDIGAAKYFVDTGNLALNYICSGRFINGGVPGGRIIELYGPPAGSKSLLGMSILHGVQKLGGFAIILDCERAVNRDFAVAAAHVDPARLVVFEPVTIKESFRKIHNVVRKIRSKMGPDVPIVFIYDSLGASPCDRELKENELSDNPTDAEFKKIVGAKQQPGERARETSDELRKLNTELSKYNATIVFINQIRMKIGVMFGNPETTPGGKALEFYASCRLRVAPQKNIVQKISDKITIPIGVNVKFQNKKNRSFHPHWETDNVQLFFNNGINPLGGLLGILIKSKRIAPAKAGNFKVLEPYAGGQEITFKSSMERNDVPASLLLDCPAVIDAESREEVQNYLSSFGSAIDLSQSEDVIETEIRDEDLEGDLE